MRNEGFYDTFSVRRIFSSRRLLWWATILVLVGTGLWVIALATPYWLIHIPGEELTDNDTPSNISTSLIDRKVVWAYSGIWRKCQLVELYHSNYGKSLTTNQSKSCFDSQIWHRAHMCQKVVLVCLK